MADDIASNKPAGPPIGGARRLIFVGATLLTLASLAWAMQFYRHVLGLLLQNEQFLAGMLALALALVYLTQPARRGTPRPSIPWYDWILAAREPRPRLLHLCPLSGLSEDMTVAADRRPDRRLHHHSAGGRSAAPPSAWR